MIFLLNMRKCAKKYEGKKAVFPSPLTDGAIVSTQPLPPLGEGGCSHLETHQTENIEQYVTQKLFFNSFGRAQDILPRAQRYHNMLSIVQYKTTSLSRSISLSSSSYTQQQQCSLPKKK